MKYKISEVSKKTGIPIDTIRYYETLGIVQPVRVNTYRYYSETDILNLLEYRKMRKYGMNMSEIMDFFQIRDIESYGQRFENLQKGYEEAARYYQVLSEYAKQSAKTIKDVAKSIGQYRLTAMPEKYYIHFYLNEENDDEESIEIWQCWINKYYSLVEYLFIFRLENFLSDTPENKYLWVNALDKEVVDALQIPLPKHVNVLPAHKAVYTVVEKTGDGFYDPEMIGGIKDYLKENSYQLDGNIVGKMIARIQDKDLERQYLGIWVPIK